MKTQMPTLKTREVTESEVKELMEYLTTTKYWGRTTRENLESIFEEVPIVVMENFRVEETNYQGKVLCVYAPEPEGTPQVYYWPHGKLAKAGNVPRT